MTIREATTHVIQTLKDIRVPMAEIQTIGVPVSQCIDILSQCVEYMVRAEQLDQAKQEEQAPEKEETENGCD